MIAALVGCCLSLPLILLVAVAAVQAEQTHRLHCLFMGAVHAPASAQGVCGSGRRACFLSIEVTSAPAFTRHLGGGGAVPLHVLMGGDWGFCSSVLVKFVRQIWSPCFDMQVPGVNQKKNGRQSKTISACFWCAHRILYWICLKMHIMHEYKPRS